MLIFLGRLFDNHLLGTTNAGLFNVSTLDSEIKAVCDTAITAGFALREVNALSLALGLSIAMKNPGEFNKNR